MTTGAHDDADELLNLLEVAAWLRVSENTLRYWRQTGDGPLAARVGRHLRYRRRDVERWLQDRQSARSERR